MVYNILIIIGGLLASFILFAKFPILRESKVADHQYKLSVIIPARNEIIVIDDASDDRTSEIAESFPVDIINIKSKPEGWAGKAWACQQGSEKAKGDILLFLDCDVRLGSCAVKSLLKEYERKGKVISLLPYHKTEKYYEQFSMFFNMVQVAGNGTAMGTFKRQVGLYGAVIMIERPIYDLIGGHESVKGSVVDDLAIGERLKEEGIPFEILLGGDIISLRMYNSLKSLFLGWAKNYSTGAAKTSLFVLGLSVLWIASSMVTVIVLIQSIIELNKMNFILGALFYCVWVLEFFRITRRIGQFKNNSIIFFPIYLAFFLIVFFISVLKKIFKLDVTWKGRQIKPNFIFPLAYGMYAG